MKITKIAIEASSKCQLNCKQCYTSSGFNKAGNIGWGNLKFSDYKKFIDKHPEIQLVELSNYGEIFLNPQISDIIKYSHKKNIKLTAYNGVNLNKLSDEQADFLVKYKFEAMKIALDGASQKTYQIYRKRGDFELVINNIKKINYFKKIYNSIYPKLIWQFVIFGHNEHELPEARKMATSLGVHFQPRLNNTTFSPVKDKEFVRNNNGLGVADLEELEQKTGIFAETSCFQLWNKPRINWDGKLLGCCFNVWGDFGNVFEKGLYECMNSEKYRYAKKMLIGKRPPRKDIPCVNCWLYKEYKFTFSMFKFNFNYNKINYRIRPFFVKLFNYINENKKRKIKNL